MAMTKTELKQKLHLESDAQIAEFFNTSRQAVGQWKAVPRARLWELRARRPELFRANRKKNDD